MPRNYQATLLSALEQSYWNLEIIVVDDGSTDKTADLVASMAVRNGCIRLICQENAGVPAACNRGIAESDGVYIAPLDADDLWHRNNIRCQVAALTAVPEAGFSYAWNSSIDEVGRISTREASTELYNGNCFAALLIHNFVGNASGAVMRRSAVLEVGGYLRADIFISRVAEFTFPQASGFARFISPVWILRDYVMESTSGILFGFGPGSLSEIVRSTGYLAHDPSWFKITFEYGILGFAISFLFFLMVLFQRCPNRLLAAALLYQFLFLGGYLHAAYISFLILTLVALHPGCTPHNTEGSL
jgi:glycosyltransferase involved in cell wall biosynthesis